MIHNYISMKTIHIILFSAIYFVAYPQNEEIQSQEDILKFKNLFDSNMKPGISCFRIPSIITAPNGDLIVAIDERVPSCGDLKWSDDINIVLRRSSDNGESYLIKENIPINKTYASPILALRALAKKENDVLLYDHTILQYYINRLSLDEKVKLLPITFKENYQSFMLPKNHPAFDLINVGLMKEIQKEHWIDLQRKYDVKGR